MKYINLLLVAICFKVSLSFSQTANDVSITGSFKKWQKITLNFKGDVLHEYGEVNPFLDYRLNVIFRNEGRVIAVPGFFAADGNAKDSGATSGAVWQVRFTPDAVGEWTYEAFFRTGKGIAVSDDFYAGKPANFNGAKGNFTVTEADNSGSALQIKGRLQYDGTRYLKYSDTGEAFLKGGADSPENFLAYYEFDQTPPSHKYATHEKDWLPTDATWKGGKGKSILGALNYLASKGMNSVYFLTMNVQGDGKDVWPWTDKNERYRYDCSKLDQWELVFDHMDKLGIMLHIVTQETENELLLDIGALQTQRKLYYRELIARFSHHLAVTWNLGEENGWETWTPKAQNNADRIAMANYIKTHDPYKNLIVLHTHSKPHSKSHILTPLLGLQSLDGPSLQTGKLANVHKDTKKWIQLSQEYGKQWVVMQDEIGPAGTGAKPDADDSTHDAVRAKVLWGNLMAGGAGVEWYFGYKYAHNDLKCEDWRSRDVLWEQTNHALRFFKEHLPFSNMASLDHLTPNTKDYVFAEQGNVYAIYLPEAEKTKINLSEATGEYTLAWYNPRTGGTLTQEKRVKGGKLVSLGMPPSKTGDWVALLKNKAPKQAIKADTKPTLTLKALEDFTPVEGDTQYYKDKRNKALAIKANIVAQRKGFAKAGAVFMGEEGLYMVTLQSMAEQDGESTYNLYKNKTLIRSLSNPQVTEPFKHVTLNFGTLYLKKGEKIYISSNAHTNGIIPEGEGTAWSRGRWNSILFTKTTILEAENLKKAKAIQPDANNKFEVEAEHFHLNTTNNSPRKWYIIKKQNQDPATHSKKYFETASGKAYLEALPDTRVSHKDELVRGENFYPIPGSGGIVAYKINVKTPGKYYVWVKALSTGPEDNGLHVGIDGTWPNSGARIQLCKGKHKWTWSSAQRIPKNHCGTPNTIFLDIKTPGVHTLMFSMREDGFKLDKFIVTPNKNLKPE